MSNVYINDFFSVFSRPRRARPGLRPHSQGPGFRTPVVLSRHGGVGHDAYIYKALAFIALGLVRVQGFGHLLLYLGHLVVY